MNRLFMIFTLLVLYLGARAQTQQEWRDSISHFSTLIEQQPNNIELRLRKAAINIELEQWRYALEEYTKVLEIQDNNIAALYYRAYVNQHLARYDQARADYEAILQQVPLDKNTLIGLALTNIADHHKTEAYDGANRLVEMFPDDADVYAVRAEIEEAMDLTEMAIDDMMKAIELEEKTVAKKGTISIEDDMASYQLQAFTLKQKAGKPAKEHLDYLVAHGIAKAQLNDYYRMIKK